jgi:hypothetical protein
MSGLPPKADLNASSRHVAQVPGATERAANKEHHSARAKSASGTSMRTVFADFRLINSSYFRGACTGTSGGFSPFDIAGRAVELSIRSGL